VARSNFLQPYSNLLEILTHIALSEKMYLMKRLLLIFILTLNFQSWTKAENISNFEIEGISIGDSALKYFTEDEIINNIRKNSYKGSDGLFFDAQFKDNNYELYEQVTLTFKKYDKNYTIYSLGGIIFYNNKQNCINDHKKIAKDVEKLFPNHIKDTLENQHHQDPTGKSFIYGILFLDENYSGAEVSCYSWSEEMDLYDYVLVAIDTSEFGQWLQNYFDNL